MKLNAGSRLRQRRTEKGLSLRDLADRTGLDHSVLGKLEKGSVRMAEHHAETLANALNCSAADFYEDATPAFPDRSFLKSLNDLDPDQLELVKRLVDMLAQKNEAKRWSE